MREKLGSPVMRYVATAATVVLALLLEMELGRRGGPEFGPLLPFAAVLVSSWFGGVGPGLLATALVALTDINPHLVRSPGPIMLGPSNQPSLLVLLCLSGVTIGGLAAASRAARQRTVREAAERVEAEQYRLLFEGNPHPMWVFDRETLEVRAVNDTAVAHYGYARDEFLAMTVADLCPPEDVAPLVGALSRSWGPARFYTGSWRHRKKDGTLIDVEITANAINFGGRFCWVVLVHDVTVRKRAQEATRFLAEAGEVLASSLDYEITLGSVARLTVPHVADFCVIDMVEADGSIRRVAIVHVNPAKGELVRALWHRDRPIAETNLQPTLRAIRSGQSLMTPVVDEEKALSGSDPERGRIIRALGFKSLMVVPLVARGRTLGAIALGISESPRRYGPADLALAEELARRAALAVDNARLYHDAEAARRQAEAADQAKDRFLAMLSHELRTPLTPVLMTATVLLDEPGLDPEIRSELEMVRRNIELEARLIDDLLDLTRISRGKMSLKPELIDAHALIHQALEICRNEIRAGGLRLELDLAAADSYVQADPARMQQVFWNLIKNAVKFTPPGGRLSIRSRNEGGEAPGPVLGRLIVEVRDTGIGIEPGLLPRIFDAFEQGEVSITRRYGGLGLGLAISRAVVESHGGSLTAASAGKGLGAAFILSLATLPAPETAARARPPAPAGAAPHRCLNILLVEDDKDTLRYLTLVLRRRGHTVLPVDRLAAALEAAVAGDAFDLVISDVELPDGTGLDLMRALRVDRAIPGIALSGFGSAEDAQMSRSAGFAEHLTKPIDLQALAAAIQRVAPAAERSPGAPAAGSVPIGGHDALQGSAAAI